MLSEVIYRGLKLSSLKCRYFKVQEGSINTLVEDTSSSCLTLTYVPGTTARALSVTLGVSTVGNIDQTLSPISGKFEKKIFSLNGMRFQCLTVDPHVLNIIITGDSESRVVQSYGRTVIVVNKDDYKNFSFLKFLFFSGNLLYIKPYGPMPQGYQLRNFPRLIIKSGGEYNSRSEVVFMLRRRYDDYTIRAVDYQDQFLLEVRRILAEYGVELIKINKEQSLTKTTYVTYQFNQTPIPYSHVKRGTSDRNILSHRQPVEFSLHTTDMVLYHDFKNKYEDVLLLTNLTEFKTADRYGERITAAVKWSSITEDFNQVYQPDDNSNFAFQCQFRCELYFYEIFDEKYQFLQEINLILDQGEAPVEKTGDNNSNSNNNSSNTGDSDSTSTDDSSTDDNNSTNKVEELDGGLHFLDQSGDKIIREKLSINKK